MPQIFQRLLSSLPPAPAPAPSTAGVTSASVTAGAPSPATQLALRKSLDATFQPTLDRLVSLSNTLLDVIIYHTTRRCTDVLNSNVTKIKQQYRMTGKPAPTTASAYVQHVLSPVRIVLAIDTSTAPITTGAGASIPPAPAATAANAFFQVSALVHNPVSSSTASSSSNTAAVTTGIVPPNPIAVAASVLIRQQLPPTHRDAQRIVESVLRRVTLRFQNRVNELLDMVEKIDISLKRLQKKSAISTGSEVTSDSDKIRMQLSLDVTEYTRLATHLLNTVGCNLPLSTHPNSPQQIATAEINALTAIVQNWSKKSGAE
jgi:hypothetical protein